MSPAHACEPRPGRAGDVLGMRQGCLLTIPVIQVLQCLGIPGVEWDRLGLGSEAHLRHGEVGWDRGQHWQGPKGAPLAMGSSPAEPVVGLRAVVPLGILSLGITGTCAMAGEGRAQ